MSESKKRQKRHKPTLHKYFPPAQIKAKKLPIQKLKQQATANDPSDVKLQEKPIVQSPPAQIRIRKLCDIINSNQTPMLINISKTPRGLVLTRPDIQRRPPSPPPAPTQKSRVEVLQNINSFNIGPDSVLYNLLTEEGFKAHLKAEQTQKQRAKQKQVSCNCKKTHCLKMYCECISKNLYCNSECQCKDCYNNAIHENQRQKSKEKVQTKKVPHKVETTNTQPTRSCNCKKSHCNKKYCECFGAGSKCSALCKCVSCYNKPPMEQPKEEEQKPITFNFMNLESLNVESQANQFHQNYQFPQYGSMRKVFFNPKQQSNFLKPPSFQNITKKE